MEFTHDGLVNNFVYCVFLSAAEKILESGGGVPTSVVLAADILPSFFVNLLAPYFIHRMPYNLRVILAAGFSFASLFIVAWVDNIVVRILGVCLCSAGSGLGELTFLMFSSFYESTSVSFWSSGTGAAGLAGSLSFLALTVWARLPLQTSLSIVSALPPLMLVAYFFVLRIPNDVLQEQKRLQKERDDMDFHLASTDSGSTVLEQGSKKDEIGNTHHALLDCPPDHTKTTFASAQVQVHSSPDVPLPHANLRPEERPLRERLVLVKPLLVPYILPLFVVYWAEYTINSGIAPTLLFEMDHTPFQKMSDHYIYYQALYQAGVFVSRSSLSILHIQRVWIPSSLQVATLVLLLTQSLFAWIPTVYVVFAIIFWEGLLGGAAYVNTFYNISKDVTPILREFAMGVCGLGSVLGISVASLTGIVLEPALCSFQVSQGNMLCRFK
ncbi:battenin CLN3 protein [Dimargaris xerosporica]|nr:battenin CLN3 protein [Dimargaris xerosporica]